MVVRSTNQRSSSLQPLTDNSCLCSFFQNQKDPLAVDKIMKDLDQCRDGKVGFQSFFSLIAGLTIACNDYFVVHMKQKGRK